MKTVIGAIVLYFVLAMTATVVLGDRFGVLLLVFDPRWMWVVGAAGVLAGAITVPLSMSGRLKTRSARILTFALTGTALLTAFNLWAFTHLGA